MSELVTTRASHTELRWQLLATASMLTLLTSVYAVTEAKAEDGDHPTVWIELGGQLERIGGTDGRFAPDFITQTPVPAPYKPESPLDAERSARFAIGGEGKLSFTPEGSKWIFSAAIRYGRSNSKNNAKHQTNFPQTICFSATYCETFPERTAAQFAKSFVRERESHMVLDFMAGKDVGLGMFGRGSDLVVQGGVRYAQFQSRLSDTVYARPYIRHYQGFPFPGPSGFPYIPGKDFVEYTMMAHSTRSFHGIGPSISMEGSTLIAGNPDDAQFTFDWGGNAAILFGRQRANGSHQTTASRFRSIVLLANGTHYTPVYSTRKTIDRSRSIAVPNVGGFAAISMKFPNAKVSLGYRGDFFFGAMDTGIDTRKTGVVGFHGPYATISIGLGG